MAIEDRFNVKGFNGVSYGAILKVLAADVTAGFVEISFDGPSNEGLPYPLAFSIMILRAGINIPLADAVITANNDGSARNGYLKIADGAATLDLTADDIIHVVAQTGRSEE